MIRVNGQSQYNISTGKYKPPTEIMTDYSQFYRNRYILKYVIKNILHQLTKSFGRSSSINLIEFLKLLTYFSFLQLIN